MPRPKDEGKINFNISMQRELRDRIDKAAANEKPPKTRSDFISMVLYQWFDADRPRPH